MGDRAGRRRAGRRAACLALLVAWSAGAPRAETLEAGGYAFSDELGGFRLLSASGAGTRGDPIVLVEEIDDIVPAVLVIRRLPVPARRPSGTLGALSLVKVVANRSGQIWVGFDLELQEEKDEPSVYGDGLSFDQIGRRPDDLSSDRFARHRSRFEPYDRIGFEDGHVDPGDTVRFSLTITDPTPKTEFYLVQDPRFLYSGPVGGPMLAGQ